MANCCSNCGCNNGTCGCGCSYHVTITPGTSTEYSATNINLTGVGVYDSQSGTEFNFRGIASANSSLGVSLDNTNHTVLLTLDVDLLINDLPQATTTQRGVGETATNAEAIAKASTTVFLTPSNLAALGATSTFAGFVELATNAEAITGTSTTLALTPANLTAVIDTLNFQQTFTDDADRGSTVPDFIGQFGGQSDNGTAYVSTGLLAGNWELLFKDGNNTTVNNVSIQLGGSWAFSTLSTQSINFNTGIGTNYNSGSILNLVTGSELQFDAAAAPANSVVIIGGTPGGVASSLLTNFLSTTNVQNGWAVTNPSVSRTLDVAAATLGDVRAVLGTLINDLKAVLLPAT